MAEYSLIPVAVPPVKTKNRTICTALPVPESLEIFKNLDGSEPRSMRGQPPIVWDHAEGSTVADRWGNRWIDWSSGVLITNIGHGHPKIVAALRAVLDKPLLATYVFVHEDRAKLTKMLADLAPRPNDYRVFLLSSGTEATENCIKLAKTYALEKYGPERKYFISFDNAFHGRTMGSQLAGGNPRLKKWLAGENAFFAQVPFPDGYKNQDTSFDLFLKTLKEKGIKPNQIAGVMSESYQGVGPDFMPKDYAKKLEAFCRENDIVLIMDEVQAGFGRTGKMFCFEHYGIQPDLIACGKGISSSLALSAVIGRKDIMDIYAPGSMTSTHSASPLAAAAAIVNLQGLQEEKLVERAAKLGVWFNQELERIQKKYPSVLGCFQGLGLVAGIQAVKAGTRTPDPDLAVRINVKCFHKGLLMFAPVGVAGECVKIAPPLSIPEDALRESLKVFEEAVDEVMAEG
ncbi:MAG: aminotransferase class III-fold pyridoxal phosphate-dependent enzyme [Verrucomicrobia bacterium]|nr:aminotransferase class III-fold pyridoxal phosphate-dependent enzyme [Verrucomicrobiota bacterium]